MVEIRNLPSGVVTAPKIPEPDAAQEIKKGRGNQAVTDILIRGTSRTTDPSSTMAPPRVPLGVLSSAQVNGAESFAMQLETMESSTKEMSPDLLLAAFLKLQILSQTKEDSFANLILEARSVLTQLAFTTVRQLSDVAASSYALQLGLEAALQATTDMAEGSVNEIREMVAESIRKVFERALDKPEEKEKPVSDKEIEKKFGRSSTKAPSTGGTGVIGVQGGQTPTTADGPGGDGSMARAGLCAQGSSARIAHLVRAQAGHNAAMQSARR